MPQQEISRTIQYFGLLRVPEDIRKNLKYWFLTFDLVRPPLQVYINTKTTTPESFYGYVQSVYADRIYNKYALKFENQIVAAETDTNLFIKEAVSCLTEAMLDSFVNLRLSLLPPTLVIQRDNPIENWRNFQIVPEEFKIKLLTETTVGTLKFIYEEMDVCRVKLIPPPPAPPPPPPPPPAPPPKPPNTPNNGLGANISPPYDGNTSDDGETYNGGADPGGGGNGGDPPPQGNPCEVGTLTANVEYSDPNSPTQTIPFSYINPNFRGPVYNVKVNQDKTAFIITAAPQVAEPCDPDAAPEDIVGAIISGALLNARVLNWSYTQP